MLKKINLDRNKIITLTLILLPVLVRVFFFNLNRIHGDDIITAYFSAHIDFFKTNLLAPVPADNSQWVCQFPSVFFILQKIFFLVIGEGLLQIKLSIMPYVLVISIFLYLTVKLLFDRFTAFVALVLYSFFAFSLYLETIGLHFISSTAVFIGFFYFLIKSFRFKNYRYSILTGIFLGLSYLFYTSSYIALPIFILFCLIQLFRERNWKVLKFAFLTILSSLIILTPFLISMIQNNNFYLSGRINQVNLISGSWVGKTNNPKFNEIINSATTNIKSIYSDGIGGHGGYDFGNLALFEKYSLILLILGLFLGVFYVFKFKEVLFILITVFISFTFGMVLTLPPPAFHRFSLAIPFLMILMSLPFYFINQINFNIILKRGLILLLLFSFIFINVKCFLISTQKEYKNQFLLLANYINSKYQGRNIHVASYPGFVFEKIYYFSSNKKNIKIDTDYHKNYLDTFKTDEKYVYLIIFPNVFNEQFQRLDKKGKIIHYSDEYSLFVN